MTKMILIEPSLMQSGRRSLTINASVWDEMREAGRKEGFAVTNETTIGPIEAALFAKAVRRGMSQVQLARGNRGSNRFTMSLPVLNEPDARARANEVLALLEAGGVVLTQKIW